mgnify:CR=1 FL=1
MKSTLKLVVNKLLEITHDLICSFAYTIHMIEWKKLGNIEIGKKAKSFPIVFENFQVLDSRVTSFILWNLAY